MNEGASTPRHATHLVEVALLPLSLEVERLDGHPRHAVKPAGAGGGAGGAGHGRLGAGYHARRAGGGARSWCNAEAMQDAHSSSKQAGWQAGAHISSGSS